MPDNAPHCFNITAHMLTDDSRRLGGRTCSKSITFTIWRVISKGHSETEGLKTYIKNYGLFALQVLTLHLRIKGPEYHLHENKKFGFFTAHEKTHDGGPSIFSCRLATCPWSTSPQQFTINQPETNMFVF